MGSQGNAWERVGDGNHLGDHRAQPARVLVRTLRRVDCHDEGVVGRIGGAGLAQLASEQRKHEAADGVDHGVDQREDGERGGARAHRAAEALEKHEEAVVDDREG